MLKVQPSWRAAVVPFVIYNLIIYATWWAVGADYTKMIGADMALKSLVLPLGLGLVFVVATLSWLGWWRPVMRDEQRAAPHWAMWPIILIIAAMVLLNFSTTNWAAIAPGHLLMLAAAGVMVGFNEEAVTRGMLVVGWRSSTNKEAWIWFWTSALFGAMHIPNAFFGTGLAAGFIQAGFAFCVGCGFYVVRRLSGTILIPMVLHGLWDFSTFAQVTSGGPSPAWKVGLQFGTYGVALICSVIMLVVMHRRATKAAHAVER